MPNCRLAARVVVLTFCTLVGIAQGIIIIVGSEMRPPFVIIAMWLVGTMVLCVGFVPATAALFRLVSGRFESVPITWNTDFWQRLRAGDFLHVFHLLGWAVITTYMAQFAAHYIYHGAPSYLALLQAPPGVGFVIGAHVAHRMLRTNGSSENGTESMQSDVNSK